MLSIKRVWSYSALVASMVTMPAIFGQQAATEPKSAITPSHFIVQAGEVKWTNPPAGTAIGTPSVDTGKPLRYALIEGDPSKPGAPFTIRLGCDDGFIAAPHWHPTAENIVVLKGTFALGAGDTFNSSSMQDIATGGYGYMPSRMHHFGLCKGETDLLIYGIGPFQINFVSGPKSQN
jgi:hypothetical protein